MPRGVCQGGECPSPPHLNEALTPATTRVTFLVPSSQQIYPSQQEDQLLEASAHALPNQPPDTSIPTTTNMVTPKTIPALTSALLLPPFPACLQTYTTGINSYLQFCSQFNIASYPASSLTLLFFCTHLAQHISYKSIKAYLAGICLAHLELGH